MEQKVGRNDPCVCGSGKKYKNCCLKNEQLKAVPLGGRKFKAKVLSGGGIHKPVEEIGEKQEQGKIWVDYTTLMERSFGEALGHDKDIPPVLADPSDYLASEEKTEKQFEQ